MGDSLRPAESTGGSMIGNGLSSDVLRARTFEFYNSCHPHVSRQNFQSSVIHKSGSMTHINGFVNGTKSFKCEQNPCGHGMNLNSVTRPPPPHYRSERPHRTHSERANKSPGGRNITQGIVNHQNVPLAKVGLYRSNSSLDLEHSEEMLDDRTGALRRDYGSASSLDVISTTGESFFAMVREFRNQNFDQRSPGPAKITEYLKGKIDPSPSSQNASNALANGTDSLEDSQSPKIKNKFHKLWEIKDKSKVKSKILSTEPSIFKKLRGNKSDTSETSSKGSDNSLDVETRLEEKLRKKAFAHYDCQSVTANLSYVSRLRSVLSKRRNTTTGASAASMLNRTPTSSTENLIPEEADPGDGKCSDLILSCPFFRNELGGEEERVISLNRMTCKKQRIPENMFGCSPILHKPNMAYGLSVLENVCGTRWKQKMCPYQRPSLCMEKVDRGALCYRQFFYCQDHQNWFGVDENLGPIAISIKREKVEQNNSNATTNSISSLSQSFYQYRLIIRTSELLVMRGTVLEEAVPTLVRSSTPRTCYAKEVLEYIGPEIQLPVLRLAIPGSQTEEQLLRLDEQGLTKTYKVGIMYCKAGQATEEEMYNNEFAGPALEEFLDMLGERVRLKSFDKYRGGLDNKTDTTGLYSVFAMHQDCEIMFHVSTLLPYTPNNKQQLLRKRHIGNDIVTIVFQESDALPFTPKNIRSHFQHVFIVVQAINPCSEGTCYRVAVSRSKEVSVFGPPIPEGAIFPKSKAFADFILAKVINAENAAHRSEKFVTMAQRTRQEYLKDLAANYCTNTTIDSGPKFSILSFGGKKKERNRPRFIPDNYILGAISWQVQVEDFGQSMVVDSLLAISVDTVIFIEESSHEVIFVCPCASIIGWSSHTSSLKVFYHQGECISLRTKDPDVDEIQEIVSRLACVTQGCETQELILRRNSLGQLGFHVQFEGIVTEVENYGFAWQAGLRQGSRLVEICKVAVSTLSYDQMVDLLKTSMTVTVTVIPPFPEGSPRKGCNLHNCSYLSGGSVGDYENISVCDPNENHHKATTPRQQAAFYSQRMASRHEMRQTSDQNRSPSSDRIHAKTEVQNISCESRRESHLQHHSVLAMRTIQDSSSAVLSSCLGTSYSGVNNLSSLEKHSSPPKQNSFPTPRSSPGCTGVSSHDHNVPVHGSSQSHLHRSFHDHSRSSMNQRLSHVGGMIAARSELSLTEITPFHSRSHSHHLALCSHPSKPPSDNIGLQLRNQQNTSSSCSPSSTKHGAKPFTKRSPSSINSDYHSDSSSDWHQSASSADELSGESRISNSPPCQHSQDAQNDQIIQSTRKLCESAQYKLSRLRPGVTSSSNRPPKATSSLAAAASSGSSCSGSTSTLQEDLLKLINPEYLDSDSNSEDPPSSSHIDSETGSRTQPSTPSSSLERSTGNTPDPALDVILTKAQPAQVISSEPSSPAPMDSRLSREERLSPRVTSDRVQNKLKPLPPPPPSPPSLIPLPDSQDIDWSSLVDTATKAIEGIPVNKSTTWLEKTKKEIEQECSSSTPTQHIQELESRLHRLQQDLVKEQHQKASLEHQVLKLREENQRLHEESQCTAAQLRRFREWLLQSREPQ